MLYTVRVTQYGMGLTYGHADFTANAADAEEATAKAKQKAKAQGIVPYKAEVISHES